MTCDHNAALAKMCQAIELLIEAYDLWPTAEVRRANDRLYEAFDELGGTNLDKLPRTTGFAKATKFA